MRLPPSDLQHRFPEQHVEGPVIEDRQLGHDLRGRGRPGESGQRPARQGPDGVGVRQRGLITTIVLTAMLVIMIMVTSIMIVIIMVTTIMTMVPGCKHDPVVGPHALSHRVNHLL